MDASTISAIAALAVAFVALLVACAQAVQQYLVSGQLIRICDSVVYGKMPGQGRRVWEYSQFRFRVVYSIPQISLSRQLWLQSSTRVVRPETEHRLPKLSLSKSQANRSSVAGEASWVSFTRTVQNASGDSLRYEMVEGDADRCPTDLPVVPMQLSMRDVVALALMAGMQCTDVSFESQSLSMQGGAGTITSSRHPVLGALIHFAPKQPFETHGIRTKKGNLDPDWIMRLSDTIIVAGCRYDQRDRRHFEEDEGSWIRSSSDRSMVQSVQEEMEKAHSPANEIRRRRQIRRHQSDSSPNEHLAAAQDLAVGSKHMDNKNCGSDNDLRRPQDGEWSFSRTIVQSQESESNHHPKSLHISAAQTSRGERLHQSISYLRRKLGTLVNSQSSESSNSVLPISEPRDDDVRLSASDLAHGQNSSPLMTTEVQNARTNGTARMRKNNQKQLDKQDLGDYIFEKRRLESSQYGTDVDPGIGSSQLLLMNKEHHNDPESNLSASPSSLAAHQDSTNDSPRTQYVVGRWQEIFKRRQRERSRRRSRGGRNTSSRQSRIRQSSRDDISSTESMMSYHEGDQTREMANENKRRVSTWPPHRERNLEYGGSSTFPREMKLNTLPRHRRRRDIEIKLSRTGSHNYITSAAHQESEPSNADKPEIILASNRHRGKSSHGPSFARASQDEDPHLRRGRRRNFSLAGRRVNLGHSNSPLVYGNAPVPSTSQGAAAERPYRSVGYSARLPQPRKVRMLSPSRSPNTSDDGIQRQGLESPTSPSQKVAPSKGVLREPRERFPEDPNFTREGVAPARLAHGERSIPAEARWTRIDRRLVNPAALDMGDERYEARPDHVIVLRVLTKEEIQVYAMETSQIRDHKRAMKRRHGRKQSPSSEDHELDVSEVSSDDSVDSAASFERFPLSPAVSEAPNSNPIFRHVEGATDAPSSPRLTESDDREVEQETTDVGSDNERLNKKRIPDSKRSSLGRSTSPPTEDMSRYNVQPHALEHEPGRMYWPREGSLGPTTSTRRSVCRQSRHRESLPINHQPPDEAAQPLTYEEELILLRSENILKHTRSSTEQCKDVSVTLKFFLDNQVHLDTRAQDVLEQINILNNLLKDLLLIIEPVRHEKKTATFVLNELDILMRSTRIPLSMLKEDFALFDISPLPLEARGREWSKLMLAFQDENPFSLPEHLELSCRYGSEILANVQAGILSTSESDILKSRICQLNGFVLESPLAHPLDSREPTSKSAAYDRRREATSRHSSLGVFPATLTKHHQAPQSNSTRRSDDSDLEDLSDDERSSLASTLAESKSTPTGEVNWLWICQADIIPGYWATPWPNLFSDAVCLGAISVLLKVLEDFTTKANIKYVESQKRYKGWLFDGKTTYPSYAHNSNGGVIVSGTYEPVKFSAFKHSIAAIELLHSYDHQVDRSPFLTTESVIDSIGELMGLDSWLSMAGRLPEIMLGPSDLLRTLPTLIQQIMTDFDLEFSSLDRTSKDGGLQIIQTIAGGLVQTLKEQNLSEAEQLFATIALLRAAKVGLCIVRGPETRKLRDVLRHDVQVYLA